MELYWHNRHPNITLPQRVLYAILREHLHGDFKQGDITATLLPGGYSNTHYKIHPRGDTTRYVLRFHQQSPSSVGRDKSIFQQLNNSVPVPKIIGSGKLTQYDLPPYTLMSFMPGISALTALQNKLICPEHLGSLVTDILSPLRCVEFTTPGRLNNHGQISRPFTSNTTAIIDYIDWCLNQPRVRQNLSDTQLTRCHQTVHKAAHLLRFTERHYHLIHGDYKLSNILVSPLHCDAKHSQAPANQWTVSAVLDWEFAHSGTVLSDIAILLRHKNKLPHHFTQSVINAVSAQYSEFPDDWYDLLPLMDIKNMLGILLGAKTRDKIASFAVQRIAETLNFYENLL